MGKTSLTPKKREGGTQHIVVCGTDMKDRRKAQNLLKTEL
jgi:hypothetical protein